MPHTARRARQQRTTKTDNKCSWCGDKSFKKSSPKTPVILYDSDFPALDTSSKQSYTSTEKVTRSSSSSTIKSYADAVTGTRSRGSEKVWKVLNNQAPTRYNGYPIYVIEAHPYFDQEDPLIIDQAFATPFDIEEWNYLIRFDEPVPFFNSYPRL